MLPTTALIRDRHGISERLSADIVSFVLQDVGMPNERDRSLVIDKSKIRLEKHKIRYSSASDFPTVELDGMCFSERKGYTFFRKK